MRAIVRYVPVSAMVMLGACGGSSAARPATTAAPAAPAAAAGAPARFAYTPSAGQYRFTSSAKITQSVMGQSQEAETSGMRVVSVTVARATGDTMSVSLVIDSINLVGPMGMTPPGVDKLVGAKYGAKISPSGHLYSATGPSEADQPLAAAMTDEVARTLPRITGVLRAGATWVDTLNDKMKQSGIELDRRVISNYAVLGDSTVGGEAAWKISRESAITATGAGAAQGQNITLQTSATSKGIVVLSKRGVLLGGESQEQSSGTVTFTANAMEVGLKATTTTTVAKVK